LPDVIDLAGDASNGQVFGMRSIFAKSLTLLCFAAGTASAADLPNEIVRQLPPGYAVLASTRAPVEGGHLFYVVALGSTRERTGFPNASDRAPARPLLVFERRSDGDYGLAGRNDEVVLRADDAGLAGNGCDPFEDGHIVAKGPYLTVENGVSCGAHWTDYVTFRFDPQLRSYAFDNWRFQSWKLNPRNDPDADALVLDVSRVVRSPKGRKTPFATWRR
jgi:hypothetical protein